MKRAYRMDFDTLITKYTWNRIYGCPGRFILKHPNKKITIDELLNEKAIVNSFPPGYAIDEVLIVKLGVCGIISYCKPDGAYIHTLNTEAGFNKKLDKLHIDPHELK
jgi:hypothetical protein